ncbi:MAG: glucosaminidase domain-containing protein [Pseudomonadota bacterium]|nr:glucosaminidase domain-containing protein [Pseudomonadota bacterium]
MIRETIKLRIESLKRLLGQFSRLSKDRIQTPQAPIFVTIIALIAILGVFYADKLSSMKAPTSDQAFQKSARGVMKRGAMHVTAPWSQETLEMASNGPLAKSRNFLARTNHNTGRSLLDTEKRHIFYASPPVDMDKLSLAQKRKMTFIKFMLPLIVDVNVMIKKERRRISLLQALFTKGYELPPEDEEWLADTADRYGLDTLDFSRLLKRVDIVPPSLAIAQAAEESGWGTSRFVREGNALFGQRAYSSQGKGIVPKNRPVGTKFRVRAFDNLIDSVRAYAHNLNTHFAYSDFRETRATLRAHHGHVNGYELAGSLQRYSERGEDYINSIRSIMRYNALQIFDAAKI